MKTRNEKMKISVLTYAVQGALAIMFAMPLTVYADDAADAAENAKNAVEAMRHPVNTVEIGVKNVTEKSSKFGEYNGLNDKGGSFVGNFNLRGGDAYNSNTGTYRYDFKGKDLGTTSRSISGSGSNQGSWSIGFGYDELQHNTTSGYQSPYVGVMGGNQFTLPAGFDGVRAYTAANDGGASIAGATRNLVGGVLPSNLAQGTLGLTAAQKALFQGIDVNNTRKNASFNAKFFLNPEMKVTFDFNRLRQSGAKLMGFGTDGSLDNAAGVAITALASTAGNEKVAILPMPTNYVTDTFNLGLHWADDKGNLSASYAGSLFTDNYQSVKFQSFWIPASASYQAAGLAANPALYSLGIEEMTTAPNNQLHQVNVVGGYAFSKETKLAGGFSYGRNTQNQAFIDSELIYRGRPSLILDPITQIKSLQGLVVTSHADLKLTNQTTNDLKLSAGVKYDQHNNRTASNMYDFSSIGFGGGPATAHETLYPNTPLSTKKTQLELAGDYRVDETQNVRLALNHEAVSRWCDNYAISAATYPAVNAAASLAAGGGGITSALVNYTKYPAGTNCVVATHQKENKLSADYRGQVGEDVNVRAGYSYGNRLTTSDPNAIVAFAAGGTGVTGNGTGTGIGNFPVNVPAIMGLNGGDVRGFYPVFDASRKQHLLKGALSWQATDELSVSFNGRYGKDKYGDSTYGVQKGDQWSLSLDATYAYNDSGSIIPFITQQRRTRAMTNFGGNSAGTAAVAATATANAVVGLPAGIWAWSNELKDQDLTIGLSAKQGDLMAGKLTIMGDLTFTRGRTGYKTGYATPGAGTYCDDPSVMSCGALPDITNETTSLKLNGNYKLDQESMVTLGYQFQKLKSTDFYYNGYQTGNTPNSVLPNNLQSGSYHVNVITAVYVYAFK